MYKRSTKLLHYGLQRSGTNFLEMLLKKKYMIQFLNSNKDRLSPLQKHFRLFDEKEYITEPQYINDIIINNFKDFEDLFATVPDYYLIISKDPYSWLLSYKNWAKKCNFLNNYESFIIEYNLFYKKWLDLSKQTQKIIFVKYVDLLQNTDSELHRLEQKMNLQKKWFSNSYSPQITKVPQSSVFTNERLSYYLEEKYLNEYTKSELMEINNQIDPYVFSSLGYEKK